MSRALFGGTLLLELHSRELDYDYLVENTSLSSVEEVKDLLFFDMPLTEELAEEIGRAFETSGELWLNLFNDDSCDESLWLGNISFPCALEPDDERNRVEFEIQCGGMEVYARHVTYPLWLRIKQAFKLIFKGIHEVDIIVGYKNVAKLYAWLQEHDHMFLKHWEGE